MTPFPALRVPPHDVPSSGLSYNVWTGAYLLSTRGARQLLALLAKEQKDFSRAVREHGWHSADHSRRHRCTLPLTSVHCVVQVLDQWMASKVRAKGNSGLRVFSWAYTNDLFVHGDERSSTRMARDGGIERYTMVRRHAPLPAPSCTPPCTRPGVDLIGLR